MQGWGGRVRGWGLDGWRLKLRLEFRGQRS